MYMYNLDVNFYIYLSRCKHLSRLCRQAAAANGNILTIRSRLFCHGSVLWCLAGCFYFLNTKFSLFVELDGGVWYFVNKQLLPSLSLFFCIGTLTTSESVLLLSECCFCCYSSFSKEGKTHSFLCCFSKIKRTNKRTRNVWFFIWQFWHRSVE